MHVFASVTAGSANPAANFCVCGICIITNNVVFIKYKTKTIIPFIHPYSPQTLVPSVTAGTVCPAAIYVVRTIYTPTNPVVSIKYHPHTSPPLSFIHLYSPQTPMLSVTAGHIPPPYMSFVQFTPPPTTLCLYNITPTHHPHYHLSNYIRHKRLCYL